jgi:hypothetical protein
MLEMISCGANFRLCFEPLGLLALIILQLKAIQGRKNWWGTLLHLFVLCVWAQAQGEGEEGAWWCFWLPLSFINEAHPSFGWTCQVWWWAQFCVV